MYVDKTRQDKTSLSLCMKKRQDNKANTVLTKSIWKDAKATQLIQCRNELTLETGFRTN